MRYLLILALGLGLCAGAHADFGKGLQAYKTGDYMTAMSIFRPLAVHGDSRAQFALGLMFDGGNGVPLDKKEAFGWYLKSAQNGNGKAQYNLALMYYNGEGIEKDIIEAVDWFKRAASSGIATAAEKMQALAVQGVPEAQFQLANMYRTGTGVTKDPQEAGRWYHAAAENGNLSAQFNLALLLELGQEKSQNYVEAISWYQRAAESGHAKAQYNLGLMYATGKGLDQDPEKAKHWFGKAAAQHNASAELALAVLNLKETNAGNYADTVKLFEQAAKQGNAQAQHQLGYAYYEGLGVEADMVQAYAWFSLAAKQGLPQAIENRDIIGKLLAPEEKAKALQLTQDLLAAN